MSQSSQGSPSHGIAAALGAGLMFGSMYISYRKAYITGMNPLTFLTFFTFGELTMMTIVAVTYYGRSRAVLARVSGKSRYFALADAGWLHVGSGRSVPELCGEVCRHQPRDPTIEYKPTMGLIARLTRVSRVAWVDWQTFTPK